MTKRLSSSQPAANGWNGTVNPANTITGSLTGPCDSGSLDRHLTLLGARRGAIFGQKYYLSYVNAVGVSDSWISFDDDILAISLTVHLFGYLPKLITKDNFVEAPSGGVGGGDRGMSRSWSWKRLIAGELLQ